MTGALIAYSIAIITEQRKHLINNFILTFLTIGFIMDFTATMFMIIGSHHIPITIHGIIGYSALSAMLFDLLFLWKLRVQNISAVSNPLHLYTRIAYIWWVTAYFAGGFIAMFHLY